MTAQPMAQGVHGAQRAEQEIEESAIRELAGRLRGPLIRPGQEGYDTARRLWNSMIDRRPALIVRPTGVADVVESVNFARAHDLLLAMRGGGHNVAGLAACDGGLMLDLSGLKGIRVDPIARTVWAQPGVVWGELDRETQLFGLATPGGFVSTTGIAGLTLGGGFGWFSRKHGYSCDNLLAVELVTADGRYLTVSEEEHADLFWGVRGGGGNFGVATGFHYRLHPLGPTVVAGLLLYPMAQAEEVLRFYRAFSEAAPDELGTLASLRLAPALPILPSGLHGAPVIGIAVCYTGSVADGEAILRPLKDFGRPLLDTIGPKPYAIHQKFLDATLPPGRQYYWKSEYLPALDEGAINTIIAYASAITSPLTNVVIFQLGGAMSRIAEECNAAGNRDAAYVLNIATQWAEPSEAPRHIEWTRAFWSAMLPFSTGGVYVNFLSEGEGQDRVRAAYRTNYARLVAVKNKYDPTNLFRVNQNIQPAV